MSDLSRWRKQYKLTQVEAARLLGVSQSYLSLLEKGARTLTETLRNRMKSVRPDDVESAATADDRFPEWLSALGYPGFEHVAKSRAKVLRPDMVLMAILAKRDADSRVVEALPWLVKTHAHQLDFAGLVRRAKLQNLQNRLGFVLQVAGVNNRDGLWAVEELHRARLLMEDTLCWDSMPSATRVWMRRNRTTLAKRWNILTRMRAEVRESAA